MSRRALIISSITTNVLFRKKSWGKEAHLYTNQKLPHSAIDDWLKREKNDKTNLIMKVMMIHLLD